MGLHWGNLIGGYVLSSAWLGLILVSKEGGLYFSGTPDLSRRLSSHLNFCLAIQMGVYSLGILSILMVNLDCQLDTPEKREPSFNCPHYTRLLVDVNVDILFSIAN